MKRSRLYAASTAFVSTLAPATVWAADGEIENFSEVTKLIKWGGVATSLLVIAGAWLALRFLRDTTDRLSAQFTNRRFVFQQLATILQFVVYVSTGVTVLALSLRLDDAALALIGGTVAVSVGFAVKDLVASFIAGIMIMVDRPFQVGDRVNFGGQYGDITAIGLRSVRLQTLDDNTVTIPNNKFLNEITSNGNYGALDMQVVMDFFIGADQDVMRAKEIVSEAAVSSRYVYLPKPVVVLVSQSMSEGHYAVRLRLKAYVLDTRYEKVFETDVNLRVMRAFRDGGVGPPAVLQRNI